MYEMVNTYHAADICVSVQCCRSKARYSWHPTWWNWKRTVTPA